ncbi:MULTISPECIES: hypothetical protein [unclassified Modestobacter]|uniref:hypothetical protein n=1 Tax=unclassified Modestobacter TaxID=2643866 RepID=UPI0022AAA716|nr:MULTISPECIES: hypothetical protein [unclassified Modestobacter]MCZ2812600.1 hypothetical protein [Modestobacter sp. VKM Ac-2979]MCZ2841490.1 hypothetical protein [Modestobacter sp. VKM Ac-2980]MCZ2850793.1 hypothetical protein [Modestobacter sp. VKM Ac-2978]
MSTPSNGQDAGGTPATGGRHTAGAYDVRVVIAALIGLYGVVLIVLGIVDYGAEEAAKTGGVNANLWAGIGMLVFALVFVAWTRLRPVVVEGGEAVEDPTGGADTAGR